MNFLLSNMPLNRTIYYYLFSIFLASVVSAGMCSRSSMAFLKPLMALPMVLPISGSLPGPKIIRTITKITKRCIGWRRPPIFHLPPLIFGLSYSALRGKSIEQSQKSLQGEYMSVNSFSSTAYKGCLPNIVPQNKPPPIRETF